VSRPQVVWAEVTIDCRDTQRVATFWGELLGTAAKPAQPDGWFALGPTVPGGPIVNFQPVPEDKVGKARIHLDLWADDLGAAVALVEQLGGATSARSTRTTSGR
jgi:glyoxalase superfamily protein